MGEFEKFQLRGLLTTREASSLIGREGSNIKSIREEFQVVIMVSKMQPKSSERIVTIRGDIEMVAKV